jgi:lysophospholipase L1-like esterase
LKKLIFILLACGILFLGYRLFLSRPDIRQDITPTGQNIICFGDSLTSGYGASGGMDYPSQLSRLLGKPIINAGIPGDTTAGALRRLEADVLSRSPRIVLMTLGGNDFKNRVPAKTAFENLKTIIEAIQDTGALVVIGGMELPILARGIGDGYRQVASETDAILIPNILEGIMDNSKLMSDLIHPNDAGYALMAKRFYDIIPAAALP